MAVEIYPHENKEQFEKEFYNVVYTWTFIILYDYGV